MKKQLFIADLLRWALFIMLLLSAYGLSAQSNTPLYFIHKETKWESPNQELYQFISLQKINIVHIMILKPNGQFHYYVTRGILEKDTLKGPNKEVRNIYTGYWKKRREKRINIQYLPLFPFYGETFFPEEEAKTASYFFENNHLRIKRQNLVFNRKKFIKHPKLSPSTIKFLNLPLKPLLEEMKAQRNQGIPTIP